MIMNISHLARFSLGEDQLLLLVSVTHTALTRRIPPSLRLRLTLGRALLVVASPLVTLISSVQLQLRNLVNQSKFSILVDQTIRC